MLDQTVSIIRERVDALGVAEPEIARQGETIQVQLPGVADQETAREVIGRTAQLQIRPVLQVIPPGAVATPTEDEQPSAEPTSGASEEPASVPTETTNADPADAPDCAEERGGAVPAPDEEVIVCERGFAPATEPGQLPEELPRDQWNRLVLGPARWWAPTSRALGASPTRPWA